MEAINIKIIKKNQFYTYMITFLLILFKYIEVWSYSFNKIFFKSKTIFLISIFLSVLIIINSKFKKKELKNVIFIGVLCLIVTFLSKSIDYIISYLMVILYLNIKNGDMKYIKSILCFSGFLFFLTIFLSFFDILPSFEIKRIVNNQIITRTNIGFYGANSLFLFFYPLVISFFILNFKEDKKIKIKYSLLVLLLSYIFYRYTNCRTGMLCIFVVTILYNISWIFQKKYIRFIIKNYYIILFLVSIFCALKFNAYNNTLNIISSGRFYFWNYYISKVKYSLFGITPFKNIPLDNAYLYNYYFYGIISFFICWYLSLKPFQNKHIDNKLFFITFAFGIYGFFENNIGYVFSFLPFYQLYTIINNFKYKEKEEVYE